MSVFVAGTDTAVGKTVVTAGLTGHLRRQGRDARTVKPCQTGHPEDDDAAYVQSICDDEAAATCPRRLGPALAPEVAAEESGEPLSYESILAACRRAIENAETAVVEGIGGLRVPLADGREVIDLAADLDLPVLVVARSGLGTLNHTALTVEALRRRDIEVRGIVLNEYEGATTAERTNPAVLEEMTGLGVATVPPMDVADGETVISTLGENVPTSFYES